MAGSFTFLFSCLSWWNKLSVFTRHTMNTRLHRRIYIVYSVASNIRLLSIHWQSEQLVWSSGNLSIDYLFIIQTTVIIIIWNSWTKYPLVNISVFVDKWLWSVRVLWIKRNFWNCWHGYCGSFICVIIWFETQYTWNFILLSDMILININVMHNNKIQKNITPKTYEKQLKV